MSGDVQPRKRKDKRRKKDDLGVEEPPRGTAAVFGEGDVLMHSHHEHGTGGHWCAKIIFFSLLSVLVTLIVLIILENRGLTELEANAVESRYSGVLDGWIEDTPDDDHHDEHTLDLKHHSYEDVHDDGDDDNQHEIETEHDEDDHSEEEFNDENEEDDNDDDGLDDDEDDDDDDAEDNDNDIDQDDKDDIHYEEKDDENDSDEKNIEEDDYDEDNERMEYNKYTYEEQAGADDDDDDDENEDDDEDNDMNNIEDLINNDSNEQDDDSKEDLKDFNEQNDNQSNELQDDDDDNIDTNEDQNDIENYENDDNENEDYEENEAENDDDEEEVERIEREVVDDEEQAISSEKFEEEIIENNKEDDDEEKEETNDEEDTSDIDEDIIEPPIVEQIPLPSGKPFVELEDEPSSEKPTDTLAEEEEYEKRQEQIRLEKEESSSQKDGGNSIGNEWPGEPSSSYWRKQLDIAEDEIRQREFESARARVSRPELAGSLRARYLVALALDEEAEYRRNNDLLSRAILAYMQLFKSSTQLSDNLLTQLATKTLSRIQFRGTYLSAEPVYRILIKRFPNEVSYRNNLTVTFLMANKPDLAAEVLKDTLKMWPDDRVALAHYGFVLKTHYKELEESVTMFRKALENDTGPACEPRFYYHLGDALLLLGRFAEADEVHRRGAAHGHFLSPAQRSLYNVDRLKSRPWWQVEETPYIKLANALERSWKEILKEGEEARALYEKEREGLKERGEWSQLDLFVRGQEIPGRCKRAPVTCSIVRTEPAAANCRRGQIKFSLMAPGTHVRPHVGPTNCRLRMHLGLSNTKNTYIRVDRETRQWHLGKVLLFDDSFEHEVWHNGTGARLVLIVDVWHPDLTALERRQLPPI
ncbi:PREDICTED: aspartyl/asparaginyl beta-hydroxylase isoform X4 [Papilio xuthus]|uniref:Aspartyl/asparaginyl beta-hydroxylase isoform X4 n=1 Tax=Papilio xuthus TaxID=66420 RepID=A0AAJ6ZNG7_PAPXU|nr:PREDICTED: aspartyl/asparaginyl beta-hydroxylase isoform X4 [Papilio xuthus]